MDYIVIVVAVVVGGEIYGLVHVVVEARGWMGCPTRRSRGRGTARGKS